jgi:thioesterase domain-containing protein/acyl carrier protein
MADGMDRADHPSEYSSLLAVVSEAWRATVPHDPFALDRELADTGIDSLKAMELALRIERQIGRSIDYGLLEPTTTPASLAAGLCADQPIGPPDDRPSLFFMTGLGGHQFHMVDAWQARLPQVACVLIDAPGLDQPREILTDLQATAVRVADDIARRQPSGAIRLAGYSFGGALGYEVSRLLIARGRAIAFLGLIDVYPPDGLLGRIVKALRAPRYLAGKLLNRVPRFRRAERRRQDASWLMDAAMRMDAMNLASRLARSGPSATDTATADRLALHHLRLKALRCWRPDPLEVPALLVATDDGIVHGASEFWCKLIPGIEIVTIAGKHRNLAAGPSAENLVKAFERRLSPGPDAEKSPSAILLTSN